MHFSLQIGFFYSLTSKIPTKQRKIYFGSHKIQVVRHFLIGTFFTRLLGRDDPKDPGFD